jgi:hypothetical protein
MSETTPHHSLGTAITRLISLHDGDAGVVEAIACGPAAIPALQSILSSRDPSGLFETRRRAVQALQGLRAFDALREFLSMPRDIVDPVERTGEDAVINAAARALGQNVDTRDMPLFFALVKTRPLAGVIDALGKYRQIRALPVFIHALGDDFTRFAAENAIRKLGFKAQSALLEAALEPDRPGASESSSSVSRRRGVLKLLQSAGLSKDSIPYGFAKLIRDHDPWISLWSCRLCLLHLEEQEKSEAMTRLIDLLQNADELLAEEIEDCLVENYNRVRDIIEATDTDGPETGSVPVWRSRDYTRRAFARVKRRVRRPADPQGASP